MRMIIFQHVCHQKSHLFNPCLRLLNKEYLWILMRSIFSSRSITRWLLHEFEKKLPFPFSFQRICKTKKRYYIRHKFITSLWWNSCYSRILLIGEKSRSQSSTFWHIREKQGFHFLMRKSRNSSDRMSPPMKLIGKVNLIILFHLAPSRMLYDKYDYVMIF